MNANQEKKTEKKEIFVPKIGMNILFEKELHLKLVRLAKASEQTCSAYIRTLIKNQKEQVSGGLEELNLEDIQKNLENGKTIFDF